MEYKLEFITPKLDLQLNSDYFIEWLNLIDKLNGGTYNQQVTNMCEFSCLYISMKFLISKPKLKGDLKVQSGKFGANFNEHYWMEYTINKKTYIIDLTLRQYIPDAPKVSIIEKIYTENGYMSPDYVDYRMSINEYCTEKNAFVIYKSPLIVEK